MWVTFATWGSFDNGPPYPGLDCRAEGCMNFTGNPGRFAGLLYVLTSIVGFFAMGYIS